MLIYSRKEVEQTFISFKKRALSGSHIFFFFFIQFIYLLSLNVVEKGKNKPVCWWFFSLSYLLFFINFLLVVLIDNQPKISRIRETLNLLTDVDSSTDTKTDRNGQKGPNRMFIHLFFYFFKNSKKSFFFFHIWSFSLQA